MATGFEGVALKAVIDGLVNLFSRSKNKRLTDKGKAALEEAMRELLMAPTDLRSAETKIRIAKAAGIISQDVELAEEWVAKHKASAKKKAGATKKTAKKKTSAKKKASGLKKSAGAKKVAKRKASARRG